MNVFTTQESQGTSEIVRYQTEGGRAFAQRDLPRMLWSPDVFMGFKRLQVHSRSIGIVCDGRTQLLIQNCENNL